MDAESLEQLVSERRGYKYIAADGESPYKKYRYDLAKRRFAFELGKDPTHDCGSGCNLATLRWIADNCLKLEGRIVECSVPPEGTIIVPYRSDGKFRADIVEFQRVCPVEEKYPALRGLSARLEDYQPVNPITAETMPDAAEVRGILNRIFGHQVWTQVGTQVWNQVGAQVWNQVGAQVGNLVWAWVRSQAWNQVGHQVWNQVGAQVGNLVWGWVRSQVWNQVWSQVWSQVWICGAFAIQSLFRLTYDHPAFDLVRLGVIVVLIGGETRVYGRDGRFLGTIDLKEKAP